MLSEFFVYLRLGFEHITDPGGLDHLLFVAVLTATDVDRPRRLFWLVTAFTLGHSLTLALATVGWIGVDVRLVEVLIPITILAVCAVNLAARPREGAADRRSGARGTGGETARYGLAAVFGLVHGLGFSSFLRAALGAEQGIVLPLFAFNTGLEIGQLAIVAGLVLTAALAMGSGALRRPAWTVGVSGAAAVAAGLMVIQRI